MSPRTPVITGMGAISAAGSGAEAAWQALRSGRECLEPLTLFASTRYAAQRVGQVREDVDHLARNVRGSRSDKLAWLAACEAVAQAGSCAEAPGAKRFPGLPPAISPGRRGVVLGATVGGMPGTERFLERLLRHQGRRGGELRFHECASATDLCAAWAGAAGPCTTVSTACSAGAMAIAMAADFIISGEADWLLAGGADSLCRLTLHGFGSLLLLDPNGCRPFDARRAGISLGEGAAMLVLEAEETARARGATILARMTGWGASCDAYHATAPHPDGRGALTAMQRALAQAGLAPADVGFVSAHGTGTPDNDAMEAKALRALFGSQLPPVASEKRCFGHTLAASGAIKAVLAVQTLRQQQLPPSLGCEQPDPTLGFEPVRASRPHRVHHVLSNSFGFGGNNVALVFSRAEPAPEPCRSPSLHALAGAHSEVRALPAFAVVGAGVIHAAGGAQPILLPPPYSGQTVPAYACGEFGAELLDPAKRRRLSRFQQMALVAAHRSLPPDALQAIPGERICVALGTGLGALNDTAAFCENLVLKEERAPRPLCFTNSVHNAQAAQVALEMALRGLNVTPVQREICFETALGQGARELATGRADLALVGAADELCPHLLAAGRRWGWWEEAAGRIQPFGVNPNPRLRLLPGEGAALFALAPLDTPWPRLATVSAIRIGRLSTPFARLDPSAEAEWILASLGPAATAQIDLFLTGANGWGPLDCAYREIARAWARLTGRSIPCAAYKSSCGEFSAASAIGFATALGLVQEKVDPARSLVLDRAAPALPRPCRQILLYTLSPSGVKGLCRICA